MNCHTRGEALAIALHHLDTLRNAKGTNGSIIAQQAKISISSSGGKDSIGERRWGDRIGLSVVTQESASVGTRIARYDTLGGYER